MSDSEDPISIKRANPWLEFQARVRKITDLASKDARGLSSLLRSKKPYAEWSDKEIVISAITWVKNAPLFDACYNGDLAIVKALILSGADITVCDKDDHDLIDYAIMGGDYVELVTWLINHGLHELIDIDGMLEWACVYNRIGISKLALECGANIKARFLNGKSLLTRACYECNIELAKLLINSGIDLNIRDESDYTTLDWVIAMFNTHATNAASTTRKEIIRILLAAGATTNKRSIPPNLNLTISVTPVAKAQEDLEAAKAEEAHVRAEEEANIIESSTRVNMNELRIADLKKVLDKEEAALIAEKEANSQIVANANAMIEKAVARTAEATTTLNIVTSHLPSPQEDIVSPSTIQHIISERQKRKIPKYIKTLVWNKYVGADTVRHKCFSCREATISITSFDCGHVVAEAKGGDITINNLRPICHDCNLAMGSKNMNDFTKEFFGWTI
jgi:ankyrin repeat protein